MMTPCVCCGKGNVYPVGPSICRNCLTIQHINEDGRVELYPSKGITKYALQKDVVDFWFRELMGIVEISPQAGDLISGYENEINQTKRTDATS